MLGVAFAGGAVGGLVTRHMNGDDTVVWIRGEGDGVVAVRAGQGERGEWFTARAGGGACGGEDADRGGQAVRVKELLVTGQRSNLGVLIGVTVTAGGRVHAADRTPAGYDPAMRNSGDTPMRPHQVMIPDDVWAAAMSKARRERRPLAEIIRYALEIYAADPGWPQDVVLPLPPPPVITIEGRPVTGVPGRCPHPRNQVRKGLCGACGMIVLPARRTHPA